MFKKSNTTLIEIMIAFTFIMVIGVIIMGAISGMNGNSNISVGINGMMETRCVEGYKFIVDQNGNTRQILDEFGKGARCGNPDPGKMGSFGSM